MRHDRAKQLARLLDELGKPARGRRGGLSIVRAMTTPDRLIHSRWYKGNY
jgi:hypothetical protein